MQVLRSESLRLTEINETVRLNRDAFYQYLYQHINAFQWKVQCDRGRDAWLGERQAISTYLHVIDVNVVRQIPTV